MQRKSRICKSILWALKSCILSGTQCSRLEGRAGFELPIPACALWCNYALQDTWPHNAWNKKVRTADTGVTCVCPSRKHEDGFVYTKETAAKLFPSCNRLLLSHTTHEDQLAVSPSMLRYYGLVIIRAESNPPSAPATHCLLSKQQVRDFQVRGYFTWIFYLLPSAIAAFFLH